MGEQTSSSTQPAESSESFEEQEALRLGTIIRTLYSFQEINEQVRDVRTSMGKNGETHFILVTSVGIGGRADLRGALESQAKEFLIKSGIDEVEHIKLSVVGEIQT